MQGLEAANDAIKRNSEVVKQSTATVADNAKAIEASAVMIRKNAEVVEASSAAIVENTKLAGASSEAIKKNLDGIAREHLVEVLKNAHEISSAPSSESIGRNADVVAKSTLAIAENDRVVRQSTEAISKKPRNDRVALEHARRTLAGQTRITRGAGRPHRRDGARIFALPRPSPGKLASGSAARWAASNKRRGAGDRKFQNITSIEVTRDQWHILVFHQCRRAGDFSRKLRAACRASAISRR